MEAKRELAGIELWGVFPGLGLHPYCIYPLNPRSVSSEVRRIHSFSLPQKFH